jgi:hypothetical protein
MSNASTWTPLAGTTLMILPGEPPLADPALGLDWGAVRSAGPSSTGADPVFPAPAPPGPYTHGLPPATCIGVRKA